MSSQGQGQTTGVTYTTRSGIVAVVPFNLNLPLTVMKRNGEMLPPARFAYKLLQWSWPKPLRYSCLQEALRIDLAHCQAPSANNSPLLLSGTTEPPGDLVLQPRAWISAPCP